jgi:hypothetical protein
LSGPRSVDVRVVDRSAERKIDDDVVGIDRAGVANTTSLETQSREGGQGIREIEQSGKGRKQEGTVKGERIRKAEAGERKEEGS